MFFVTQDGGLTAAGYTLVAVAVFLLLIVISVFAGGRKKIGAKQLAYCSMALALAVVCSQIKLFRLPTGGSITLFSMLFVVLIGYWYGPVVGLLAGVDLRSVHRLSAADACGLPARIRCSRNFRFLL